jgi:hypothetical protein
MHYLMTELDTRHATPKLAAIIGDHLKASPYRGNFLACWLCEIGTIGRVLLMHGYDSIAALNFDRETVAQSPARYGLGDALLAASTTAYQPFPFSFMPPVAAGNFGPFFEVRNYRLKVGAVPTIIEEWALALPPRMALSKPLAVMYSMDGLGPRMMHIWPYTSLDERQRVRARGFETGVWPPKGGDPDIITTQLVEIYVPTPFSPVR